MSGGFVGRYCIVNLSTRKTEIVKPDEAFYKKYLSGYGLGAAVITERQMPGIDPLSPKSYLGFCSGLLTGTGAYFSGRFMVVGKSPLTGGWGDANAGGFFSQELKRAGYDAVFFTGASRTPVWVYIGDDGIKFNSASKLWGKDALETEESIKKKLKDDKVQVASIGQSGERMSLISGIVTDGGRISGRSGLGAVMGSKKLKALAVRGKRDVGVSRPEVMKEINREFLKEFRKSKAQDRLTVKIMHYVGQIIARTGISIPTQPSLVREIFRDYGTSGLTAYSAMVGDSPVKNWIGTGINDFPLSRSAQISDDSVIAYQKRRYNCQSCPLGCGGIIDIKKGRFAGFEGHKPEYETLCSFGTLILHDDLDAIIELNEMCNRAGIDTISTGAVVAFAIECFENGLIDEKKTGGLKLGWGRSEEIIKLTEMIINRKGIGNILADGVKKASERIGKGSEKFAVHAGGQEVSMHDPRLDPGYGIAYQCEPTPGRHTISCYLYAHVFGVKKLFPAARSMIRRAKGKQAKQVSLYVAMSYFMQLINGCGLCEFGPMTIPFPIVEYLNAATGWDLSADEYFKIGERILNIRKAFNVREGVRPENQKLHVRAVGSPPLTSGPLKGVTVDMEGLQREFFDIVRWDPSTGGPTPEKKEELGIG
jgi:aldehyde:ferredoxin oxidoreductase